MPLYEYQCDACGHRFESIQKFSDPPLERCPECGQRVRKLQSAPAIQFKGAGWYITDYAKKDATSTGKPGDAAPTSSQASDKEPAAAKTTADSAAPANRPSEATPSATEPKSGG